MSSEKTNQPTSTPNRKVTASAAGGAIGTILVLGAAWIGIADAPPPGLEGAFATLGAFVGGYVLRERA